MSRAATVVQSKARVYIFKTDAEGLWHNNEQTLAVGTCLIGKQGVGDGRRGEGGGVLEEGATRSAYSHLGGQTPLLLLTSQGRYVGQ